MAWMTPIRNLAWLLGVVCLFGLMLCGPADAQDAPPQTTPAVEETPVAPQPDEAVPGEDADEPAEGDTPPADGSNGQAETPPNVFEQQPSETLSKVWNATLFTAGDTDIKLNQIVIALLAVILGLWLAKLLTRLITGRLVRVSKVSEAAAHSIGKVFYYIAAAVVLLIAMQVAGIPTTVFTVLGGALAIGVGFGAQNLFNNLISGIIILTEKPIRRRDIVVIDDMEGQVAEIGNRRTRIRTGDGIDVLVPNSKFLENNVINWTLYDAKIRGWVEVGVAYGSPVKQVRDLLLKVADEHDKVRSSPEPEVLFKAFGDNTLNFSVCFWTEVSQPMDLRRIESDLRFRIDELFHKHNITIAFPQRDVHLDTLRPLEVRMLDAHANSTK